MSNDNGADAKLAALMVKLREKGVLSSADIEDIEHDTENITPFLWGNG